VTCIHCETPLPEHSRFCPTCGAETGDPHSSPRVPLGSSAEVLVRLRDVVKGRYEIQELLGRGGMGAVFLATDLSLDRPVAIKVLPPDLSNDKRFFQRFEHEARIAAKLDHPHIIPIYAVESGGDLNYFVMKFVTGRTLDQLLLSGPLPVDVAQRIVWEAACALGHAHQRGVVHRDVKPANIMIDDGGRAMVTDFGISKALEDASGFTTTGQVIGTPHYMSPEQAKGLVVDGRTDQYSLGIVAYRLLGGRLPYMDDSVHTVIYKHIFEMPPPLSTFRPDAPEFLATAIHRAIQKDPDDRFATIEEFATAVWPEHPVRSYSVSGGQASRSSLDAATEITSPEERPAPPSRRAWAGAVVAIGVVLVAAGAAGANYWLRRDGAGTEAVPGGPAAVMAAADSTPAAVSDSTPSRREVNASAPLGNVPERTSRPVEPPASPPGPPVGFLTVDVVNGFGKVYIDGIEVNDTPLANHEVSPGRHVIEVRREGFRTIVDTVEIAAGNEFRRMLTQVPSDP
jgi:serine/threonine-protein kinase